MAKSLKVIRGYSGMARFLAECEADGDGCARVVREAVRPGGAGDRYVYSRSIPVYLWDGVEVVVMETAHLRYEVMPAPAETYVETE